MGQTIIEHLRETAVKQLFTNKEMQKAWPVWKKEIDKRTSGQTYHNSYDDIGDSLRDIFSSTKPTEKDKRTQSGLSTSGYLWEALVCWYLNLCLIGRRTVVVKNSVELVPECIRDAITVSYDNSVFNTEADLIAITFPDNEDYRCDKDDIKVDGKNGKIVRTYKIKRSKYNLLEVLNSLCERDFTDLEVHIIQCKTNWNDNAQIPMLWDIVYSTEKFRNSIMVGRNDHFIKDLKNFTYSFVTVPTVDINKIDTNKLCVQRVRHLSGGNYWGLPEKSGIAFSIKNMLDKNLRTGSDKRVHNTIEKAICSLDTEYSYFGLK